MEAPRLKDALEQYIDGKDNNRPQRLEQLYTPNARLSFQMDAADMAFPPQVSGNREIARILSADFNRKYRQVKTYYLNHDNLVLDGYRIEKQPWLVLMQEIDTGTVRAGCGYYNWQFVDAAEGNWQIDRHHISIHQMLSLPAERFKWLQTLQNDLPYPWLALDQAIAVLESDSAVAPLANYLKQFR
ncbi:hypothetical protein [Marinobacterium arenosum]|uniref:hypothetical protein n=1 Tax=Marinobacterium arenosum TaxID=2862496 RepID=UPI001C986697|nr:hypothetical protein [Marinobacterium arenosum]MBY4678903.1 hypothetical protein [Marinobacterium arenosum]